MEVLLILCFILLVGIIIRQVKHSAREKAFKVSPEELIIIQQCGDHYIISFDASSFPSESDDSWNTFYSYEPELVFTEEERVKTGDVIATLYIRRNSAFPTHSTGTRHSSYHIAWFPIKSPYDGIVRRTYDFKRQMAKFVVCELYLPDSDSIPPCLNNKHGITKSEYDDMISVCKKIVELRDSFCIDVGIMEAVDSLLNKPTILTSDHVDNVILSDATLCYEELGERLVFDSKESFGLISLAWLLISNKPYPSYGNVDRFYDIAPMVTEYVRASKTIADAIGKNDDLIFPCLLSENQGKKDRYIILLHRWTSLVAELDNKVIPEEKQWLAKLVDLQHRSCEGIPVKQL